MTTETTTQTATLPERGTSDPIEAARAEVRRLLEVELDLAAKRDAAAASLPDLETTVGDAVLDGGDAVEIAARIAGARAEVEVLDRTITAARERRVAAITAVFEAEADELRRQAAAKRAEADARRGKTALLLLQLEAHEGVAYAPVQPDQAAFMDPTGLAGGGAPSLGVITRRIPRTEFLLIEAQLLEDQARAQRDVTRHGYLEADSVDELTAGTTSDPMHVGPTIASTREWAASGVAKVEADIARAEARGGLEARAWGKGQPIRFVLYWGQGVINVGSSRIFAASQEPVAETGRYGLRYDRTTR